MPKHKDLNSLIDNSTSSREFFLSLPVDIQMQLHQQNTMIHTAHELRQNAVLLQNHAEFLERTRPQLEQDDENWR